MLSAPIYGLLQWQFASVPYLHRMLWTLGLLVMVMALITLARPLKEPKPLPVRQDMDMRTSPGVFIAAALVIALVVAIFVVFH